MEMVRLVIVFPGGNICHECTKERAEAVIKEWTSFHNGSVGAYSKVCVVDDAMAFLFAAINGIYYYYGKTAQEKMAEALAKQADSGENWKSDED